MVAYKELPEETAKHIRSLGVYVLEEYAKNTMPPSTFAAKTAWKSAGCEHIAAMVDYLQDYRRISLSSESAVIDHVEYVINFNMLAPVIPTHDWLAFLSCRISDIPEHFLPVLNGLMKSLLASDSRIGSIRELASLQNT